jgi:hypothetical protein
MSLPKKRGRPKSAATLERDRIEEMLKNTPSYLPKMTAEKKKQMLESIAHGESIRLDILKTYKTSATIPDDHAYQMASLGDGSMICHEHAVIQRDESYLQQARALRAAGVRIVSDTAASRAKALCEKNRALLEIMKPFGHLTLSDVASKIRRDWANVHPHSLMPGETMKLTERGLEGDPPSMRTIKNYIQQASPFPEQRVGKTSLRKK